MNWKTEAEEKLRGYEPRKRAIENILDELEAAKSAYEGIRGAVTDKTPVKGGGSAAEDYMLTNIVRREELKRALKQAKVWVRTVDRALKVLSDEERLVLERLFIHSARGNVARVRDELGLLEDSSVYKRKDKALRRFTLALYGAVETQ